MDALRIGPIELIEGGHRIQSVVEIGDKKYPVYFASQDCTFIASPEAFVAFSIWPAMKRGLPITIEGSASHRFLASLEDVQALIRSWKPNYHKVAVQGLVPEIPRELPGKRTGLFLSLGIDSFFSFFRHTDDISDLVFVHGFDIPLKEAGVRQRVSEMLHKVGEHYGKRVIEVETNVRSFLDEYVHWGFSHGAVLGSVGNLLAGDFQRMFIAAAVPTSLLYPYGVHPQLDPLWGTERLEFIHDGLDTTKVSKVPSIVQHELALQTLRVCLISPERTYAYNCGRCEKCLRSMVYLRTWGALERCTTFDVPLDLGRVAQIKATTPLGLHSFTECLEILEEKGADPELQTTLRMLINRPSWQKKTIHWLSKQRHQFSVRISRLNRR